MSCWEHVESEKDNRERHVFVLCVCSTPEKNTHPCHFAAQLYGKLLGVVV